MMKKVISLLLVGAMSLSILATALAEPVESVKIFVAPYGDDYNTGLLRSAAVKTPQKAAERARQYKEAGKATEIIFAEGTYTLDESIVLTAEDSGSSETAPVIWRADNDAEVAFTMGEKITADKFTTYQGNVKVVDISEWEPDTIVENTYLDSVVYQGGKMLGISRDIAPEMVLKDAKNWVYYIPDGRIWKSDTIVEAQVEYAYRYNKVTIADAGTTITTSGLVAGTTVMNTLSGVDKPGEYYIDYAAKKLYIYSYEGAENEDVYFTIGGQRHYTNENGNLASYSVGSDMIAIDGAEHLRFENIDLFCGADKGYDIKNGNDIVIYGSYLTGFGRLAIDSENTYGLVVADSEIAYVSEGAVTLSGGDRYTLDRSDNIIRNSKIHNVGMRYKRGYDDHSEGVVLEGVGATVSHNEIYDVPAAAVMFSGNDHLIEYNKIYNATESLWDMGPIYSGRSWTGLGTVIDHNYIFREYGNDAYDSIWGDAHDEVLDGTSGKDRPAIYIDDLQSGITVTNNVVYNYSEAAMFGGGSYNVYSNNVSVDVRRGLAFDARGLGWGSKHLDLAYDPYSGQIYTEVKEFIGEPVGSEPKAPEGTRPTAAPGENATQDEKDLWNAWNTYDVNVSQRENYKARIAENAAKWEANKDKWIAHYPEFAEVLERFEAFDKATAGQDVDEILELKQIVKAGTDAEGNKNDEAKAAQNQLNKIYNGLNGRTAALYTLCAPYENEVENNYYYSVWQDWHNKTWKPEGWENQQENSVWTVKMPNGQVTEWKYDQYDDESGKLNSGKSPYGVAVNRDKGPDPTDPNSKYYQPSFNTNDFGGAPKGYEFILTSKEDLGFLVDGKTQPEYGDGHVITLDNNLEGCPQGVEGIGIGAEKYVASTSDTSDYVNEAYKFDTIAAIYDNSGKLQGIQVQNDAMLYEGQEIKMNFDVPEKAETGWKVKVMLWDSLAGMIPVGTRVIEVQ